MATCQKGVWICILICTTAILDSLSGPGVLPDQPLQRLEEPLVAKVAQSRPFARCVQKPAGLNHDPSLMSVLMRGAF